MKGAIKLQSLYRGYYTSVHVLLFLFNELGKIDKRTRMSSILSLFRNNSNKSFYTGARMLDSIYHMTFKILKSCILGVKMSRFSTARTWLGVWSLGYGIQFQVWV